MNRYPEPIKQDLIIELKNKIDAKRKQNDSSLDEIRTSFLRGEISAYKNLIRDLEKDG